MTAKKVTREDLYEQVWKTPMSSLAAKYGVSDVALAKTCVRLDVPRPGRGYWARLAAGEKLPRPMLPKVRPGRDEWTFLQHVENPIPRVPRPEPPTVRIPRDLGRAHEAIRKLGVALGDASPDQYDRIVVTGASYPALAVTIATHRRALLLLDALSKVLTTRGHAVTLEEDGVHRRLTVSVFGEAVALSIVERLEQREHTPTAEEQARIERGFRYGIPKYDHFASGRLQLTLHDVSAPRSSWSDTGTRRLERGLGTVVLSAESEVDRRRAHRLAEEEKQKQREQRRREQEEEQRRQREREARAKYQDALAKNLREMARNWSEAEEIRAFLRAIHEAVPLEKRDEKMVAWLEWAGRCAAGLDPLSRANDVAKRLEPDLNTS